MSDQEPAVSAIADETTTDDAVLTTGPVPAVQLASGHLHVSVRRGVTLAAVDGALDGDLAAELAPALRSALVDAEAVVLDLDQATLLDRDAMVALCEVLAALESGRCCIVAGRLSSRLVLERWGLPESMLVFSSVADALQARTFQENGYGTGWSTGS